MIFRIKIFGIFRFPNKIFFEFFFINSSSISKKNQFFFSKCRQKIQKSCFFCTWFRQFSSSESFKKQVSTPAMFCETDCTHNNTVQTNIQQNNSEQSNIQSNNPKLISNSQNNYQQQISFQAQTISIQCRHRDSS